MNENEGVFEFHITRAKSHMCIIIRLLHKELIHALWN